MSDTSSHESPAAPDTPATPTVPSTPAGDSPETTAPTEKSPRKGAAVAKKVGAALLAGAAVLGVRLATADDGTHGIQVGQCVADKGSQDFEQVDCSASNSAGKVTFVATDVKTAEKEALDLCDQHGADTAYTSATSEGGEGAVICVASK